jgi:hypothetical protein
MYTSVVDPQLRFFLSLYCFSFCFEQPQRVQLAEFPLFRFAAEPHRCACGCAASGHTHDQAVETARQAAPTRASVCLFAVRLASGRGLCLCLPAAWLSASAWLRASLAAVLEAVMESRSKKRTASGGWLVLI